MEKNISPLATGILQGLEEAIADAKGYEVEGMKKTTIYREKFNHTEWREDFFDDIDAKEFNEQTANYSKNNPLKFKKKQIKI